MKSQYFLSALVFLSMTVHGQGWIDVITSSDNYHEIAANAESYFARVGKGSGTGHKQYMRWQYQMEKKVGVDGRIRNFSALNLKAYRKLQHQVARMRVTHGSWENLGPFDYYTSDSYSGGGVGRVNCTGFHPTDPDVFWIGGPNGGLWKTTDAGSTWSPMTDAFSSIGISGIAVNQNDPNILYVLTGDGDGSDSPSIGVMKTTNGGITWNNTALQFGPDSLVYGYKLIAHPTDPQIIFATFRNRNSSFGTGIYRSTDGGSAWTQVDSNRTVWDIEFHPGDATIMYAAASGSGTIRNFLRSTDTGQSWQIVNDPDFPDTSARVTIAISPAEPNNVYALFGGSNTVAGTFRGIYKSTDSGLNFTLQGNSPNILASDMAGNNMGDQAPYDLCMVVDPEDDTKVFVGGVNMWKSENSGVTWQRETWWLRNDPLNPYVHADWHNLYYENGWLYANVDGGIFRSEDDGNSWAELTSGLSIMQFYNIDILNDEYMGGSQDNGTNATNVSNPQVHNIWGGDGFGCTWHTGDNSIQYISSQNAILRRQFGTALPISPIELGDGDFWFTNIEMHRTDPDYVFVSTFNEIYRGNGDAFSFSWDSLFLSNTFTNGGMIVRNYVQGTDNPDMMYACIGNRVLRCTDITLSTPVWTQLSNPFDSVQSPMDVEVDPADAQRLWVCLGGYTDSLKVFFSPDSGTTWTNISGSLPNVPMLSLLYEPGSNDGIYVGTNIGVFYRNTSMSDWIYFSNFLANTSVSDMEIGSGYLYAGTYGRGIWRTPVYSSCPTDLVLTPGNDPGNPFSIGIQKYHAGNSIETSRLIQGNFAEIHYGAGYFVDMLDGFWSKSGNFMEAKVENCPD